MNINQQIAILFLLEVDVYAVGRKTPYCDFRLRYDRQSCLRIISQKWCTVPHKDYYLEKLKIWSFYHGF